ADALNREHGDAPGYYRHFRDLVERGQGCTEAVALNEHAGLPGGSRYLLDANGVPVAQLAPAPPATALLQELTPGQQRPRPGLQRGMAYLPILPRITLLVVGGGHVGQAVARLASNVEFDVWVIDDRERFASQERFPTATRRLVGDIGNCLKELAQRDITP